MQNEIGAVVDLLSHPGFWTGLGFGLLAASLLLAAGLGRERSPSGWGLAFASAIAIGSWLQFEVDPMMYVFAGVMAVAGLVGDVILGPPDRSLQWVPSIGFWAVALAIVLGLTSLLPVGDLRWAALAFPLVVVGSAIGIWLLSRSDASDALGPIVAISVAGMWVTVPETDLITVLVGVAVPFGLATIPPTRARSLIAGSLALSGILAWVVLLEGIPRPWTIVGAWATLATLPLLGVLAQRRPPKLNVYAIGFIHFLYVVVVTRVADITDSPGVVAISMVALLLLTAVAVLISPRLLLPAES